MMREVDSFEGMVGSCFEMRDVFGKVQKLALTDVPVLVTGETGTGKELAARAFHQCSNRRDQPCVVANSVTLGRVLDVLLFGSEESAEPDLDARNKCLLARAHGGTLILDEISDFPIELQVKLLRFLEEQEAERAEVSTVRRLDLRLVSTTNKDLSVAMHEGRFREELYHRLAVIVIALPPLRKRGADVEQLANALFTRYAREHQKTVFGFTSSAIAALHSHAWPGNVRELANRINRAIILTEEPKVSPADLELSNSWLNDLPNLRNARKELERELVQKALARHQNNLTQVATELGVSRTTLYDLMERLGIKRT